MKNLKNRTVLIIAILVVFLYGIFGIPHGFSGADLATAITKRINLGLDLRGGAHLVLQVQVKEAVNSTTDNTVASIEQDLKKANLGFSQVFKPNPLRVDPKTNKEVGQPELIQIDGVSQMNVTAVHSLLDEKYSNEYDINDLANGSITVTMKPLVERDLNEKTVQQAIETIGDRVNALGVTEPLIQEYNLGANQILVELPGISNLDQVKEIISSTARLAIHAVEGDPNGYPDEQSAIQAMGGTLSPDDMLAHGSAQATSSSDTVYVLKRVAVVEGTDFRSAEPGTDENTGQRTVNFTLTNEAGSRFWDYTSANVGKSMAVVMGGRVRSVARIDSGIHDTGQITGSFSQEEVMALSKLLRTGALPASLIYLQQQTVGASLGADSIREGITAAVAGMVLVWIFMLVYYKGAGVNADLALFLNLVILLGFMGFVHATLTLPGIAGVILTIGMGVDSNVLIFERIREEIRAGKSAAAAVDQGFGHAWHTIFDTHVTTIVSAAILFIFGTGPVKGFATTLVFGLLANLFTAVYISRVIFEGHLNKLKPGEMVSI